MCMHLSIRQNLVGQLFYKLSGVVKFQMPPTLPAKIQLRDVRLYTRAIVPKEKLPGLKNAVEEKVLASAKLVTPAKSTDNNIPVRPTKRGNPTQPDGAGPPKARKNLENTSMMEVPE